jgi:hypothetical protein
MWLSASENIIPSVSTKPFMGLRGPDVATSITAGPSASGARPRIPCEKKSILGVLLQLDNAVLHRGFNTPHIIGYIWGYFGTSYVAFVDVYRMCAVQEHAVLAITYQTLQYYSEREFARQFDWASWRIFANLRGASLPVVL